MTNEAKHTPGPWKKEHFSIYDYWIKKPEGGVICNLTAGSGDELEECEANGRLIAAAPELLEALEAFLASKRESGAWTIVAGGNSDRAGKNLTYASEKAIAAIAKAKGLAA